MTMTRSTDQLILTFDRASDFVSRFKTALTKVSLERSQKTMSDHSKPNF